MSKATTEPTTEAQKIAIESMINTQSNTNWSPLPPEAEQHVEQAFIHLTEAWEIVEE